MRSHWMLLLLVAAGIMLLAACAPLPSLDGNAGSSPAPVETAVQPVAPTEPPPAAAPTDAPAAAVTLSGVLTGTVTYRERIALPADARVTVLLLDTSLADAPAQTVAEQTFTPDGRQVPLPFELKYDPQAIEAKRNYSVQAQIEIGGTRRWISTQVYRVLTAANPGSGIEVMVQQIDTTPVAPPSNGLEGRNWVLVSYGAPGQETAVPQGVEVSAAFSKGAGQVAGRAACNSYFGAFTSDGATLKIGGLGSTKMMCDAEQMTVESAYLKALSSVDSYRIDGDTLQLSYDGGKGVLNFTLLK